VGPEDAAVYGVGVRGPDALGSTCYEFRFVACDEQLVQADDGFGDLEYAAFFAQGVVDLGDESDVLEAGQQVPERAALSAQGGGDFRASVVAGGDGGESGGVRGRIRDRGLLAQEQASLAEHRRGRVQQAADYPGREVLDAGRSSAAAHFQVSGRSTDQGVDLERQVRVVFEPPEPGGFSESEGPALRVRGWLCRAAVRRR
jgi:hypothetical protein